MPDVGAALLPDCRARETRGRIYRRGIVWIPVYCASCGVDCGQMIPEANRDFAFWICDPCAEKHPEALTGMYLEPDRIWFERVHQEQLALFGRDLSATELDVELANPDSKLSMLAKDRPLYGGG